MIDGYKVVVGVPAGCSATLVCCSIPTPRQGDH